MVLGNLAPTTLKFYNATLSQFYEFLLGLHPRYCPFPVNPGHVGLYVVHLFNCGYAGSTITSRLSAISYAYQLFKRPNPVDDFVVQRALKTARKLRPQKDTRLPLPPKVLHEIVACTHLLGFPYYLQILFKSMMTLAFAAFLRPGEMTDSPNNIQFYDVQVFESTVMIVFAQYKHSTGVPFTAYVEAVDSPYCPVVLLKDYLRLRGPYAGALFVTIGGLPVSYSTFKSMFETALRKVGVRGRMSPHSIRIGAASNAAAAGYSDTSIQKFGRWKSNAFGNYVKFPELFM